MRVADEHHVRRDVFDFGLQQILGAVIKSKVVEQAGRSCVCQVKSAVR